MSGVFGNKLKISIFGESHGPAIGLLADGFPAGEQVDLEALSRFLARRSAVGKSYATGRKEADIPHFLSGLLNGRLLSSPLCVMIENTAQHSADYDTLRDVPRPGHADYTAYCRHGRDVDLRGGGHYSGRLTAPLCVAGGIAIQILYRRGIEVFAHIHSLHGVADRPFDPVSVGTCERESLACAQFPVLDTDAGAEMLAEIEKAKDAGDSVGGVIECAVTGLAPGSCGEHIFDGLDGHIAQALFAVPAVKGVEFGAGFACAQLYGSENNDPFAVGPDGRITCTGNNHGGILGGMASGMPLIVRAAVKPTPSIYKQQPSVSIKENCDVALEIKGRHDPCIVPRAVPCIESAAALAVLDALLDSQTGF